MQLCSTRMTSSPLSMTSPAISSFDQTLNSPDTNFGELVWPFYSTARDQQLQQQQQQQQHTQSPYRQLSLDETSILDKKTASENTQTCSPILAARSNSMPICTRNLSNTDFREFAKKNSQKVHRISRKFPTLEILKILRAV